MTRRYRHCFVVGLLIFLCGQWCFGAVISATSPSTLSLTRGDRIELEISAPSANIIEWYLEGKKIKKGSRVEILTGDLGPGDYKIYALALLGNALEVALFRMSLEPSPILYKPKVIKPGLVTTGSVSTLPPNQWWVTSLRGHLTEDTGTGRKLDSSRSLPDFLTIEKSAGIRQGAGTDSVWTWVDRQEMLFFRVPALVKRRSRELQLDSGRFVWRRLTPNPLAAEAYNSKSGSIEVGQDVKIASSGLGDLFFEVKSVDGKFVVDLFSVGTDFSLQCGQNLVIVSRDDFGRRVTFDKTKDGCKFLNTKELDLRASIMGWAKDFFPQWFEEPIGALEHLVRLDMRQPEEVNDVTLLTTQTMKMIQERRWASVLDALVPIFENGLQTSDLLIGRGTAWQALDFKGLAEKDFKAALEESTQNYRAAKSLGDLRSLAGDHSKALYWYFTALGWGHPDKPELYRLMSGESVKLGAMRNAVAFVEEAYWYEESEETAGVDFNRRINLDDQRSSRGVVTTGLGVRSHVLPIERAEFGDLTNQATTNRGLIMEAEGEWQKQLTKDSSAEVRLDGNHMIKYPANALLSTGSMSDHLIGIRMKSARRLVQMGGSFHLGTRLRGGERQTDEFRPGLSVVFLGPVSIQADIFAVKALDPNPAGVDSLDSRISVFVDNADHSHNDFGFGLGVRSTSPGSWWAGGLGVSNIDFRRAPMDDYDAQEVELSGLYGVRVFKRFFFEGGLGQNQKKYRSFGSDSLLTLESNFGWQPWPLWRLSVYGHYFARKSAMESYNYIGHEYGLRTAVAL